MQFGYTAQGLLLKEGRIQLSGRTGEQISHAGFRESAGFRDPVRPFRRICCGCNRTDWPSLKLLVGYISSCFYFHLSVILSVTTCLPTGCQNYSSISEGFIASRILSR